MNNKQAEFRAYIGKPSGGQWADDLDIRVIQINSYIGGLENKSYICIEDWLMLDSLPECIECGYAYSVKPMDKPGRFILTRDDEIIELQEVGT